MYQLIFVLRTFYNSYLAINFACITIIICKNNCEHKNNDTLIILSEMAISKNSDSVVRQLQILNKNFSFNGGIIKI